MLLFFGLISVAIPFIWLIAELHARPGMRIFLGLLSIAVVGSWIYCIAGALQVFNYNAWYGNATSNLINSSLDAIEDGQQDRVLTVWRGLRKQYEPTYENRANYNVLVDEAVARIRGVTTIAPESEWDAGPFNPQTWSGHWENDTGFWLVISSSGPQFGIQRSGIDKLMKFVSLTPDARTLVFQEGERWRHTLTLASKYEANHEWYDLSAKSVWRREPIYKLTRATPEQRKFTQQQE